MGMVDFPEAELRQAFDDLSYSEFKLWIAIKLRIMYNDLNSPQWPCVISTWQLGEDTGMTKAWIITRTRHLVKLGYLTRRIDKLTRAYIYSEPNLLPYERARPYPVPRKRKRIAA
jgi:hypothetical protein